MAQSTAPDQTDEKPRGTTYATEGIAFAAYFGAALVAGGVAYNNAYNNAFEYDVRSTDALFDAGVSFCVDVLLSGYLWLAAIFAILLAGTYYLARAVVPPVVGYSTLLFLLLLTFFGCVWLGNSQGASDATRDRLLDTTTLRPIKLYVDGKNLKNDDSDDADFDDGDFHLVGMTDDRFLLIVPAQSLPAVQRVTAIKRAYVNRYEIELK